MADTIREALERLQQYAAAHPEHDTAELVAAARAALAAERPAPAEPDTDADPIRQALESLLAAEAYIHVAGPEYVQARDAAYAALAAKPPAPAPPLLCEPPVPAVPDEVGEAFAELERRQENLNRYRDLREALAAEPPAPAPAADYAARLRRCPTHGQLPANALVCPECLRELREELARLRGSAVDGEREEREELATFLTKEAVAMDYWFERDTAKKVRRAAALLRQLPPEGLEAIRYCVEEDGAVIQRTSREPESWAIRAGSSCMSTTGEWDIEPMPSDRTDEWLTNHRWPSAAAAWAALQRARRQEVGDA